MIPIITAIEQSPDLGQALARDIPVRWALGEVGQVYEVRLVSFSAMKQSAHRALQPFGQIPSYEEGDLALFESGAIVFHIAEHRAGLLSNDAANARARTITWMFAALCTVEPLEWLPINEDRIRNRLTDLSVRLGESEWLDGVHRRRSAFGSGAAQTGVMACWTAIRTSSPTSPAAKRGRPSTCVRRPVGGIRRHAAPPVGR